MKPDYIKVKFHGPTNTRPSRYRVVWLNGDRCEWVRREWDFQHMGDQFKAGGWTFLFDDGPWAYFSRPAKED